MEGVSQLPINTPPQLGNLPVYPERHAFVPNVPNADIQVESGNMGAVPWYAQSMNGGQQQQQQQPPTFQPPLVSFFETDNPQNYNSVAETSFQSGGFQPESSTQPGFMDLNQGFPNNEQNPSWGVNGVTLNMWSMAPSGFE